MAHIGLLTAGRPGPLMVQAPLSAGMWKQAVGVVQPLLLLLGVAQPLLMLLVGLA